MNTKPIVLYPSADHFQRSDDTVVPLTWAHAQLGDLLQAIPAEDRNKATCTWPVRVEYPRTLSALEIAQDRAAAAEEQLQRVRSLKPRDGESWDSSRLEALSQALLG